jgi:hypothetical protein
MSIATRFLATSVICYGVLCAGSPAARGQQMESPRGTAEVTLKGQKITIDYGRPSARGRKIMGGLVPYGQVWRTGANAATGLDTPVDLVIGDTTVPAGKYTLYSLVNNGSWKLIINKQAGQWGTEYDQSQDLARVDMKVSKTDVPVEQFTISWKETGPNKADLIMEWENTRASVPVRAK